MNNRIQQWSNFFNLYHESREIKVKTVPSKRDYIQYDGNAFLVQRVYHIPKNIDGKDICDKVGVILFGEFVSDSSISDL